MAARQRFMGAAAADTLRIPWAAVVGFADLGTRPGIGARPQGRVAVFLARPIVAGVIAAVGEGAALSRRAGEDFMADGAGMRLHIGPGLVIRGFRRTAPRIADAFLVQRGTWRETLHGVKVIDIARDHLAMRVIPGAGANAVARVDGGATRTVLRAQISMPCVIARAHGCCKPLAMRVHSREAAEIGALLYAGAGDEKTHRLLRRCLRIREIGTGQKTRSPARNRRCDLFHAEPRAV